jgi:hypothetical protein
MDPFKIVFDGLDYTNSQNNIFYHMFCVNDALDRFLRTYSKIQLSGLINKTDFIYINCVGKNKHIYSQKIHQLPKVNINIGNHDRDESETLNILRRFCINNINGNVLYLHSKGSSKPNCKYRKLWKECMEYFLIEEYEKCLSLLYDFDSCGVELLGSYRNKKILRDPNILKIDNQNKSNIQTSWYAGNFWWAKNYYISKLKPCTDNSRWDSEFKFLSPHLGRCYNLYSLPDNKQFHKNLIHRDIYTKKLL